MRKCQVCQCDEHPAAPFVEGLCDRCRQTTSAGTVSGSSAFVGQFKSIPNGIALVVLSGIVEAIAVAAMLAGTSIANSTEGERQMVGLVVLFVGGVLAGLSAIAFMLGILRWSLGPYVEIVVRQNDHLIGLLKAQRK